MLGILLLLSVVSSICSAGSYHRGRYPQFLPWKPQYYRPTRYRPRPLLRQNPPYQYEVASSTTQVDDGAKRREDIENDYLLKQYLYTMLLFSLFSEKKPSLTDTLSALLPFQRTYTLPTPEAASPPTTSSLSTRSTQDSSIHDWKNIGKCKYLTVTEKDDYYGAKADCRLLGARLAVPSLIKEATDIEAFTTKLGLNGKAFWVGVEEDSSGRDVPSNKEPEYSQISPYPNQHCLAMIALPVAAIDSYRLCQTITPAYVCQIC